MPRLRPVPVIKFHFSRANIGPVPGQILVPGQSTFRLTVKKLIGPGPILALRTDIGFHDWNEPKGTTNKGTGKSIWTYILRVGDLIVTFPKIVTKVIFGKGLIF